MKNDFFPIDSDYYNGLYIKGFSSMLDNPTTCYKFYWVESIIKLIRDENIDVATFDSIFNEMIANAWYTVREFHVHLSGKLKGNIIDSLEQIINRLADISGLPSEADKKSIKEKIRDFNSDETILRHKKQLANYVPSRVLGEFYNLYEKNFGGEKIDRDVRPKNIEQTKKINERILLPYIFDSNKNFNRAIILNQEWKEFIRMNSIALLGWIQFEKTKWLQKVNPDVPNIVSKLSYVERTRNSLDRVRILWDSVLDRVGISDICGYPVEKTNYDIDHFIPWSFVMTDELWNLAPMKPTLNSSKSNLLPNWDKFFKPFADCLFKMYQLKLSNDVVKRNFDDCNPDFMRCNWNDELFKEGNNDEEFFNILQRNMKPIYDSAHNQKFDIWDGKDN